MSGIAGLVFILIPINSQSSVKFGAFLDTYIARNLTSPKTYKRSFTTQPTLMNEPQVNMAYVDGVLNQNDWRGRLALQYGSSVDTNYIFERNKTVQAVQEAYVGRALSEKLWVDAGIFLGNIGAESWISKYNWTYTRALHSDYVPYYSSGIRFEYLLNSRQNLQIQILNGWQNIQENISSKTLGLQYRYEITPSLTFTYNNFLGDDIVAVKRSRFRQYHNLILKYLHSDKWHYLIAFDFGFQSQEFNSGIDGMMAPTLTLRRLFSSIQSLAMRLEYYDDPHQTTVITKTSNGFQVLGASLNYDHEFDKNIIWRTEARTLRSKDRIYPQNEGLTRNHETIIVTSIGITI